MISRFKKYFVPNRENDHQPHFLRKKIVLAILVFILLLEAAFLVQIFLIVPWTNIFSSILPNVLIDLTNNSRQQNSLPSLAFNPLLAEAAQLKAQDMAIKGYFDHVSPEGREPWYWLDKVGYKYSGAGENLAVNFVDSQDIEKAWMESPGHRANILDESFSEIGIGAAQGTYKGQPTIFVVQFFGSPLVRAVKPAAASSQLVKQSLPPGPKTSPAADLASPAAEVFSAQVEKPEENSLLWPIASQPASLADKWLTMPRGLVNSVYFGLAALVVLALILKIFVKIRIQRVRLIFNGIFILFVIISIFYLNSLLISPGNVF